MRKLLTLQAIIILALLTLSVPVWAGPFVLFDQAHGQRFLPTDQAPLGLSGLADVLKAQGIDVRSSKEPITDATLAGAAGIIISGPFAPFTPAEIDSLLRYAQQGGSIAVMLHIAPPVNPLLHRLGVASANGVIREQNRVIGSEPLNFSVVPAAEHPLTTGLESFNLYGAWALLPVEPHARTIAATTDKAWIDRDGDKKQGPRDAVQSFAVAVAGTLGKGSFIVFGDDAIFQNQFLKDGNRQLADNLAHWFNH